MTEKKKLSKQEYILKAAKLYGLGNVEIEALTNHLNGSMPNDFIRRRTDSLFRLYDIYSQDENPERIKMNSEGIVDLNDYSFEISKRRLADSKIGKFWILESNLDCFLVTTSAKQNYSIDKKYRGIAEKNNFLLPQVARRLGLDAVVYYKGKYKAPNGTFATHHLTKNFLNDEETLIEGASIVKVDDSKKIGIKRIKLESLLKQTDEYLKKHYKKYKLPEEEQVLVRGDTRKTLIKQTFFNKFVFNENEANGKWGVIKGPDNRLRIAPIFSYDYCCGAVPNIKTWHRCVNRKQRRYSKFYVKIW